MADPIKLEVVTDADTSDLTKLGQTLDDVATDGESMGAKIEDALDKAEAATRPTNTEFKALARSLDDLARASGKTKTEALDDLKRAAAEAGTELRQGTLDALERLAAQGPRDVDKVREAVNDLKRAAGDAAQDMRDEFTDQPILTKDDIFDASFAAEVQASARETGGEILGQIASSIAEGDLSGESLGVALSEGLVEIGAEIGGPAGAAAVAGGLIGASVFGAMAREREELQESVNEMFETWVEKGAAASEALFIESNIKEIATDIDQLNEAQRVSAETGISLADILRAMAGDAEAWNSIYERTGDLSLTEAQNLLGVEKAYRANREAVDATKVGVEAYHDAIDALPNKKNTDVNVDDNGTVSRTQGRINSLRGRDIPVSAYVSQSSIDGIYNTIGGIRLPAIVVQARLGQAAV